MNRRQFLSASLVSVLYAVMQPKSVFSNELLPPPSTEGVEQKREFIQKVSLFAQEQLGLQIGKRFYTDWAEENRLNYFLYVSLPNKIVSPTGIKHYLYFAKDENAALAKQAELDDTGYHTLLYKTAGTSKTELTNELLSYPYEALTFVVLHEAFHAHLENTGKTIPYPIEEAFADLIGNWGSIMFAQQTNALKENEAINHKDLNEKIYRCILAAKDKAQYSAQSLTYEISQKCEAQIKDLIQNANHFYKNRYDYPVNNAYFLRNQFYTDYYFQLYRLFKNKKSLPNCISIISDLPADLDKALGILWQSSH